MKVDLHRVFELNVSEAKCNRTKRGILDSLDGSFTDSYNKLEAYATELRSCNSGYDIVINLSKKALSKLLRMYIFKANLRPSIWLDVTFFKEKAKEQVLVVVSQDNMNCFYPLAWVVVDKETTWTWTWFMKQL